MDRHNPKFRFFVEQALPWIVLAVLLIYTYAKFAEHPYSGFRLSTDGQVFAIYVENTEQPSLMLDDKVLQIGPLSWEDFKSDHRKTLFEGVQPGQVVPLIVERDGQQITIPWVLPGPNPLEILDLIVNEGWLAYVFWLVGTLTLLHLRPKDERWILMVAFNYLTAVWLVAGSGVSFYHIWGSAIVLRMAIWLSVPVYLHFHWVYPKPFRKLPAPVILTGYSIAVVLAITEWFQILPSSTYFLGFLLAVGGSLLLLIAHMIFQVEARRDLRLLMIATFLALIPAAILGIFGTFSEIPTPAGAGTIGLPFLPLAYFYASYRRQVGQAEFRVNRLISIYIYSILIGTIAFGLMTLASIWINSKADALLLGALVATLTALVSIWFYPQFQTFVERRLLGIPLPPSNLQEIYSARIATSTSLSNLLELLEAKVLPSLLVRQFVFLQLDDPSPKVLLAKVVTAEEVLNGFNFAQLMAVSGKYRPTQLADNEQPCPWARLVLPLKVGNAVIGFWLLGYRDPDDAYSQAEIPIFQSLANQTAVALSNLLQAERLRAMYQANVNRYEEERKLLALELHDSILNQMAVLMMNMDVPNPSSKFQEAYDDLTQRLREIVSNLRPPMLNYGLKSAFEELADNLMERSKDTASVTIQLQSDGDRYPPDVELHLFRIVQEACENALRHARAKNIKISGNLDAQVVNLDFQDDGIGFGLGETLNLDTLIARKQFGLAGMIERAAIIGAQVRIEPKPEEGTRIELTWKQGSV